MNPETRKSYSDDRSHLFPERPVLIVEDDRNFAELLLSMLRETGITNTEVVSDPRLVFPAIEEHQSELVLLDLGLPYNIRGEDILERLARERPQALVVVITGDNNPNTVVDCMRHGAYDYIVKPVQVNRLSTTLNRALELTQLRRENVELKHRMLRDQLEHPEHFADIITMDRQMVSLMAYLETLAHNMLPVLIQGEIGTGKDLLARSLHLASGRRGEFITLPAPGLKSDVFLPLLFGIMAPNPHPGLAEVQALLAQARGGTLVIQEVGEADEESQARLLGLFEKRKWARIDPSEPVNLANQFDVRVVLTTRHDLSRQVDKGLFRKDLFYRIQGQTIEVPPLRQRRDDIPILANHFLSVGAEIYQRNRRPSFDGDAMEALRNHHFEGNVRELQAIITQALSAEKSSRIRADRIRRVIQRKDTDNTDGSGAPVDFVLRGAGNFPTFKKTMTILIKDAMARTGGKQTEAAKLLGISRQALNKRLKAIKD